MGMAGDTWAAATLSPALRMALLASTAFATVLAATAAANAACNPNPPANGDTATCTGTTNGQGPDAGVGYGSIALTNLHITVAPGASVTGAIIGIAFIDGTVISSGALAGSRGIFASGTANVTNHAAGTITGGDFGISANLANVINSGGITGNLDGISSATSATVTNSGTITGTTGGGIEATTGAAVVTNTGTITGNSGGIYAGTTAIVSNSGSITGGTAIHGNTATVTNSGTITAVDNGVFADTIATVTNSGSIIATTSDGVRALNTAFVTNSGAIMGGGRGVVADTANVTNSGSITGTIDGILAAIAANVINTGTITGTNFHGIVSNGSATVTNSGTVTGNGGITAFGGDATVTNSGTITAVAYNAIYSSMNSTVINSGVIASAGANYNGISATDTATVTNSGTITGGFVGVGTGAIAIVTNSGTISGGSTGVGSDGTTTVINSGTITGQSRQGVFGSDSVTLTNSGTVTGGANGVVSNGTTTVTNTGTIRGGSNGISGGGSVTATNSATVVGGVYGIFTSGTGVVTTSGLISGGSGTAIKFNANGTAASDTLNILSGARFGGRVDFGGGADRVNFGPGNWVLDTAQYDAALSTVTTPGTPYFITPNQIIVADVSSFRMMKRAIMDITGWISSVLPDSPVFDPSALRGATAFAAIDAPAPRFDDAFANFPSALPYAPTPAFTGGTVNDAHGNSFWAKGFGGRRDQGAGDGVIAGITTGAGIAIGFDRNITANTRLGVLAGGSENDTPFDLNAGSIGIDTKFAGLHSRTLTGSSFLDLALIGGTLDNESKRNINGGTPQTASARYDGWFLTPLLTLGHRFALPYNLTLTPAVKVRYVAAHFDGYAESGSSGNLTVAAQDFQGVEERAEVTLAGIQYWGGSRIVFRAHAGLLARQYAGDETVNVAFIGNTVLAAIGERGTYGLYAGGGFAWQTGNVALFASGEVTGMNDNSTILAGKGGMRVVW